MEGANFASSLQDHDCIDFTDNSLSSLSNFPLSPRLHTLLLARNRLTQIQPSLSTSLPNITTIVFTQNNFAELADLEPLRGFSRLLHLSLLENPVTRKEVGISIIVGENCVFLKLSLTPTSSELQILDHLANSYDSFPRLSKGKGCGAGKGGEAIWYPHGAISSCIQGRSFQPSFSQLPVFLKAR